MNSIQINNIIQDKKDESLIDKLNDSNSKSLLKSNQGNELKLSLFTKSNNRRTKNGKELTMSYTAKFNGGKTIRKNRALTLNEDTERKMNSSISETETSLKNLEQKFSKKVKSFEESKKSKNSIQDKIIVDSIEHIYSKIKEMPLKIKIQNIFLYLTILLIGIFDWSFLFQLSENKLERNYCFTNLNQFDSCSIEQICKNYNSKINYIIYNNSINFLGKNENENTFLEENESINFYYKQFFLNYSYILSNNQFLNSYQLFSTMRNNNNFVIILTSKGSWNIFLKYFFVCQKKNYSLIILLAYFFGGIFGCLIFGLQADIRGRKKIIQINLLIMVFGFLIIIFYIYYIEHYYKIYKKEFNKKYSYSHSNVNNIQYKEILEKIHVQNLVQILMNKTFIVFIIGEFIANIGACPLLKICLSLLIENATNEDIALQNYRKYFFFNKGCSPLFGILIIVNINSISWSYNILCVFTFLLFICSFFVLNESMRYYYELCEWKNLSQFIINNFNLEKDNDLQFLSENELRSFQREENDIVNKEYEIRRLNLKEDKENDEIFEKNNFYNYYQRKKSFLIRGIKRKLHIIIKYKEINYNPLIIIICLQANRHFIKSKYILFSILILMNLFQTTLQLEMAKKPFFRESDLFFAKGQNIFLNSNFFAILIITYISNIFFYYLYRISCFRFIVISSSILLSILSFFYHIHNINNSKTPLYYNEYNFGMMDIHYKDIHKLKELFVHAMYFAINGILFYIDLLVIKISKTIYRCTLFSFHSIVILLGLLLAQIFNIEIKKPFLLLTFINLICLLLILFLNEMKDLPDLVSDLKKNAEKRKTKHEKSE